MKTLIPYFVFRFIYNYFCLYSGMMECLDDELKHFNSAVKTSTVLPYFVKTNPLYSALVDIRYIYTL